VIILATDAWPAADAVPTTRHLDETLDRLLREHGAAIARVARLYEFDAARREDLFQEICVAIWRALPSFRGESSERTFIFRIAHNRGVSHRARQRPPAEPIDEAGDIAHPAPHPDAGIYRQQQRAALEAAVARLPVVLAQVLTLTLEGLSQRDIADVLGISENNVAVRATRARARVKAMLAGSGDDRERA
jgi:RNA polymerase sigma factor (sigma-70 family)